MAIKKINRAKLTDGKRAEAAEWTKAAEAVTQMTKLDDKALNPIASALKAELAQLIRDVKSGFIASRVSAERDFFDRLDDAVEKANKIIDELNKEAKNKGKEEEEELPDGPWSFVSAELTAPADMKKATDDLKDLLARAGNLYATNQGTVVGGKKAKSGKKIDGLNDSSARVDVQAPPKKGLHNVQYQIGDDSVAAVLFWDTDTEAEVKEYLLESLKKKKKAVSPAAAYMQKKL